MRQVKCCWIIELLNTPLSNPHRASVHGIGTAGADRNRSHQLTSDHERLPADLKRGFLHRPPNADTDDIHRWRTFDNRGWLLYFITVVSLFRDSPVIYLIYHRSPARCCRSRRERDAVQQRIKPPSQHYLALLRLRRPDFSYSSGNCATQA